MCEILVRVVDKVNPNDAVLNRQCRKAGDVVCVKPDGWGWSVMERTNPEWKILKIPNVDVSVFEDMLIPELDTSDPENTIVIRQCQKNLDLTIPWFASVINGKQEVTIRIPTEKLMNDVLALKKTKVPIGQVVIG